MTAEIKVLLTATVNIGNVAKTARADPAIRLADYKAAASFYAEALPDRPILLVENSAQPAWPDLSQHRNLHYTSFHGNDFSPELGKGVGEMNIISRALEQTAFPIRDEDIVLKITGRLIVKNIRRLVKTLEVGAHDITCDLMRSLDFADSRCFAARAFVLRRYLLPQRTRVNDSSGFYFEHALASATLSAIANGHDWSLLPVTPYFSGTTGTSGREIDSSLHRFLMLDLKRRIKRQFFQR